jgi:Tfp pilus assembly protein PilO
MSKSVLIVFILLCVFATVFFVSWPRYQELKNTQAKIAEKEVELQYKEQHFRDLTDAAKELTKYKEELLKIDSILPSDPSIPALFSFLQTAASQNGLTLEGLNLSAVSEVSGSEGSGIKEISVSLNVSGSYPSLKSLLSTLEKTSRLIEVETISLSAPQEADKPFSFNLAIKTHSY